MPLSVDLEAEIEESCAETLVPWTPLADDDAIDLGDFDEARQTVAAHETKLRALRIVDDRDGVITGERLRELLALPALVDLEVLMLPMCKLGSKGEGIETIVAAPLPRLRLLDVRKTAVGDAGARIIASSKLASQLEHLSIAGAYLSVEGFKALLDSALGKRKASLHVEEEGQDESIIPTLMSRFYELAKGDDDKMTHAFERLLAHPALTKESCDELRYQWELVVSN